MRHSDALVIGAGPAGASVAILLAQAGWTVSLVEQHVYPRQKVCGECIAAGNFALLDELGVGQEFRRLAGAELRQVGWMRGDTTVTANMPACPRSASPYGRALGRDVFDAMLLERARQLGVHIWQPARVHKVSGRPGSFRCEISQPHMPRTSGSPRNAVAIVASIVIDAHGSWVSGPRFEGVRDDGHRPRHRASDLFAFKATFSGSTLPPGLLPVVAVDGGYGGLVAANDGRTTVALCLRRDALRALRVKQPGAPAGAAVESYLRASCHGVRDALRGARREGSWLTVGPLQPGARLYETPGIYRVGNAFAETHPLIGEGISMALQSSKLLAESLLLHADRCTDTHALQASHQHYTSAWLNAFRPRMRLAALYAHVAVRAPLAAPVGKCLSRWPALLTTAARLAGKARPAADFPPLIEASL